MSFKVLSMFVAKSHLTYWTDGGVDDHKRGGVMFGEPSFQGERGQVGPLAIDGGASHRIGEREEHEDGVREKRQSDAENHSIRFLEIDNNNEMNK